MKTLWKYIALVLLSIFIGNKLYAQKDFRIANKYYDNFEYQLAIPFYKKALNLDSNLETLERLAFSLKSTNQYKEAIKYYQLALNIPYYTASSVYYYAEVLLKTGNYEEAQNQFELYLNYEPNNKEYIKACIKSCEFARQNQQINSKIKIKNLTEVNSKFSESSIYITEKNLYISSNKKQGTSIKLDGWTGNSYYKIYVVPYKINKDIIQTQRLKLFDANISGNYHAMYPSFNASEEKVYYSFTNIEENPKRKFKIRPKDFINRISIVEAEKTGRKWHINSNLKNKDSIEYSILHPYLSKDGKRIYFASDKAGGYGSYDLYYCNIDSGKYSEPINMGPTINTIGMEVFPSISEDSVLYFSSNAHPGYGGLDLFKVSLLDNSSPINLGIPINSFSDDFSFVYSKEKNLRLFCSDREGGKGSDDVYFIEMK